MRTVIRGGRVIDPALGLDAVCDIAIENGFISEIGENVDAAYARVVDAEGAIVAPGFIDMHVHLREPGQTHKETIATGAAAAVAGGFTAVACMPNTEPALDSATIVADVVRRAEAAGLARVYPIGALTKARAGVELAPYHLLADAGCVAFSDDGTTVANPLVLRNAARYASDLGAIFVSPAILYVLLLVGVPFLMAVYYSVSAYTIYDPSWRFVGLANFEDILEDPSFRETLYNTFVFTFGSQILGLILGKFGALVLLRPFPGRKFVRALVILPWATIGGAVNLY